MVKSVGSWRQSVRIAGWLSFCAFLFGLAWWRGGFSEWFLFYGSAALLGYAALLPVCTLRGLRALRTLSAERLLAGEPIEVALRIVYRSWLPPLWIVLREEWIRLETEAERVPEVTATGGRLLLRVRGRNEEDTTGRLIFRRLLLFPGRNGLLQLRYRLSGLRRGHYRFAGLAVTTGDVFGLWTSTRVFPASPRAVWGTGLEEAGATGFTVLPRPLGVSLPEAGAAATESGERAARRSFAAGSAWSGGVREYAPGDPLRRIHWKAAAHAGSLRTKETEPQAVGRLCIALDACAEAVRGPGGSAAFDAVVEAAAGLWREAAALRRPVGIRASDAVGTAWPPAPAGFGAGAGLLRGAAGGTVAGAPAGFEAGDRAATFRDAVAGATVGSPRGAAAGEALAALRPDGPERFAVWLSAACDRLPPDAALAVVTSQLDDTLEGELRRQRAFGRTVRLLWVHRAAAPAWPERRRMERLALHGVDVQAVAVPKHLLWKEGTSDADAS